MNALLEFSNAEKGSPPLDQQFIIFRYKKIINEDQDTIDLGEALDVVSGIAYDSHFRQCQTNIHKAAMFFLDFWGILNQNNSTPDLYKLNELGLKINETLKNVHTHWHHMQHYKAGDPKAMKMYASFWTEILNNKEKGLEYLNSKEAGDKRQVVMKEFDLNKDENLATNMNEGYALLVCNAETDNFGTVFKSSSNSCKLFGYTHNEMWGKHIDQLFLDIYSGNICVYLKQVLNDLGMEKSRKKYNFFGKTKTHHCISLNVELVETKKIINDKEHFLLLISNSVNLNDLKKFKKSCLFIVNSNLQIFHYSVQTIELLYLLFGKNPNEFNYFYHLFPEILGETEASVIPDINLIKINDTVFGDVLDQNEEKTIEINVKSRASKSDLMNIRSNLNLVHIDLDYFFNKNYKCWFSLKQIDTLSENFESINKIKIEDSDTNQNSQKELFYSIKIDYLVNEKFQNIQNFDNNITPNANHDFLKEKETSFINLDKKFNLSTMMEKKVLKLDINKVSQEIKETKVQGQSFMFYLRDIEKFKSLYKWMNEEELIKYKQNLSLTENEKRSRMFSKKESPNKKSIKKGDGNTIIADEAAKAINAEKLSRVFSPSQGNLQINTPKIKDSDINDSKRLIDGDAQNKNDDSSNDEIHDDSDKSPEFKSNNEESIDDFEGEEEEDSEEESEEDSDQVSFAEGVDAKDILDSQEVLDLPKLTKKLESLKVFSKNVEFYTFKDGPERIAFPPDCQIIEVMKNVNLLHEDIDQKKEKQHVVNTNFSASKKNSETNHIKPPPSLNKLRLSSFVTLLTLLTYSIVDFYLNNQANNVILSNVNMIKNSYQAVDEVIWSSYLIRNIILSNNINFLDFSGFPDRNSFVDMNYRMLNLTYKNLQYIQSNITVSDLSISSQQNQLLRLNTIPFHFSNLSIPSDVNFMTLTDAINRVYVKILTLIQLNASLITDSNTDVISLQYNCYNDFLVSLKQSAALYTILMQSNCNFYTNLFIAMFSVCILLSIIFTITSYLNLTKVDLDRTKILSAFYQIPHDYVSRLYEKCTKFIDKIEHIEGNDSDEESDNNSNDEEIEAFNKKTNFKHYMLNTKQNTKMYLLQIGFVFLLVIVFFLINFVENMILYKNLLQINIIFNTTLQAESLYTFAYNLGREKLINPQFQVFNTTDMSVLNSSIIRLYELNSDIMMQHIEDDYILSDSYLSLFKNISYYDLCPLINNTNCKSFVSGFGSYGLQLLSSRYFEFMSAIFNNNILNPQTSYINVFNSQIFKDTSIINHNFLKVLMRMITDNLNSNISSILSYQLNFRLIIFVVFIVFIIIGYFFLWLPFENKLNDEITRTKKMLDIIPLQIVEKIDSLKEIQGN